MSTSVATQTQYTPEDLLAMPDGKSYELVGGQLVERKMGMESSWVAYAVTLEAGAVLRGAWTGLGASSLTTAISAFPTSRAWSASPMSRSFGSGACPVVWFQRVGPRSLRISWLKWSRRTKPYTSLMTS